MASTVSAQTLTEALALAYATNPNLIAERARQRATDELMPQALSNWRPRVTVAAEAGRSRSDSNLPTVSDDYRSPRRATLSVQQPLYRGGRTVAGVRQARNQIAAGQAVLTAIEQSVLLAAATAYMNVVRDQAVLELSLGNVEVLRRQLEATQDRFRVGEITKTDVAQAEARLAQAIAGRVQAESDLQASRAVFATIVGRAPGELEANGPIEDLPDSRKAAVELAAVNNPEVIAAIRTAEAAIAGIDVVRGELRPTLSLDATLTSSEDTAARNVRSEAAEATVNLTMPLYQAGAVYSRVRQQKHTANQRRIEIQQERRDAVENATQAWEAWQAARASIDAFGAQVRASEIALEGVRREAQVGARTVIDVLDAEQELLEGRVNLVTAERNTRVAGFQLQTAVGTFTAGALGLPVEIYEPEEHYRRIRNKLFGTGVELVEAVE